eukprot:c22497_g1_i2 orf=501-875(-)
MANIVRKLWRFLQSKELMGVDKFGNCYFRQSKKMDGALTEKRWVEFKGDPDPTTVPVEWTSWLVGRRKVAPTAQELMELEAQRNLVKMKAARLQSQKGERMPFNQGYGAQTEDLALLVSFLVLK